MMPRENRGFFLSIITFSGVLRFLHILVNSYKIISQDWPNMDFFIVGRERLQIMRGQART